MVSSEIPVNHIYVTRYNTPVCKYFRSKFTVCNQGEKVSAVVSRAKRLNGTKNRTFDIEALKKRRRKNWSLMAFLAFLLDGTMKSQ